jgi:hypothetical protein
MTASDITMRYDKGLTWSVYGDRGLGGLMGVFSLGVIRALVGRPVKVCHLETTQHMVGLYHALRQQYDKL